MTAGEAFDKLFSGTGLTHRYLDDKTVTIVPVSAPDAKSASTLTFPQKLRRNLR